MAERYSRVYTLPSQLYTQTSPVIVEAGALLRDNQTGRILAQLKIKNIQPVALKMVTAEVTPLDPVGRPLGEVVVHKYMDLRVNRDMSFGSQEPIVISHTDARTFQVKIIEVCFADNTIWTSSEEWTALPEIRPIESLISNPELVRQYQMFYGTNAKYRAETVFDLWYCTCGALNTQKETACYICNKQSSSVFYPNIDELTFAMHSRLVEEKQQREQAEAKRKAEAEEVARKAMKIKKFAMIVAPVVIAVAVFVYLLNAVILPNMRYKDAIALMESGSYTEAVEAFEAMGNYKDSVQRIENCYTAIKDTAYEEAIMLMESGRYMEAISAFEMLGAYRDCEQKIKKCSDELKEKQYIQAIEMMNSGSYADAIDIFKTLVDYKDSKQLIDAAMMEYKKTMYDTAKVGRSIFLGHYEQDGNRANGAEEIEWVILTVESNSALVISKYALDCRQYSPNHNMWESSTIRNWLNGAFFDEVFDSRERSRIKNTEHFCSNNVKSTDSLFFLSADDLKMYYRDDKSRECLPTTFCQEQKCPTYDSKVIWWTSTAGHFSADVKFVGYDGSISEKGTDCRMEAAVRPAMWITLEP